MADYGGYTRDAKKLGLVVKFMEKPNSCDKCQFRDYEVGTCLADVQERFTGNLADSKPEWCPCVDLSEILER